MWRFKMSFVRVDVGVGLENSNLRGVFTQSDRVERQDPWLQANRCFNLLAKRILIGFELHRVDLKFRDANHFLL